MPAKNTRRREPVTLVIPVYNEKEAVAETVRSYDAVLRRLGRPYEILVVDDGSTDGTSDILPSLPVRVVRHPKNRGNGAATKTGILHSRHDLILMTDADMTYPAEAVPEILAGIDEGYDMVVGARRTEQGTVKWLRRPVKWLIRKLAETVTGARIPDLNSGLRAFRRSHSLRFFNLLPDTHSWVSTITLCYLSNYYTVKYVPIDYFKRKGRSKFHPVRDTFNYVALIFRTVMYFAPLRFFVPASALLLLAGLGRLVWSVARLGYNRPLNTVLILSGLILAVIGLLADLIIKSTRNQYFKWSPAPDHKAP